jgi:hypothetical protein
MFPATVLIILVVASTTRTRLLSAIYIFPDVSNFTLIGNWSFAFVARSPSPVTPNFPQIPATVVIMPVDIGTLRIQELY